MKKQITIIDYGAGNLKNLKNAFDYLRFPNRISSDPVEILQAERLALPGVGAFGFAMQNLRDRGLHEILPEKIRQGTPLLGICLGMQLLLSQSEEGGLFAGLNLIPGNVRRFQIDLKVPHMGWNTLEPRQESILVRALPRPAYAYFVHSYFCAPENPAHVVAETNYQISFASMIQKDHIFGVQFHPEKSQETGLQIIKNFMEY
jgi:glutamine amidotransferase